MRRVTLRWATPLLAMVLLVSFYVLFAPRASGPQGLVGADKIVHAGLFAAISVAVVLRFGHGVRWMGPVAAYAVGSELIQAFFLPTRSGDLLDVLADLVGAAAGWWTLVAWRR